MKVTMFLVALLFLVQCGDKNSPDEKAISRESSLTASPTASPTPGVSVEVSNLVQLPDDESRKIDSEKQADLLRQEFHLKNVPATLKKADFKNFRYPFGRLIDGKYERDYPQTGGESYEFSTIYYVDLTGDSQKEAVVEINEISCGGSCDGGRALFYFYSAIDGKIKLIGRVLTGSSGYGCSLKKISIVSKLIDLDQYGRCMKRTDAPSNYMEFTCKFCVKDETHSRYKFVNGKLSRISAEIVATPERNVMNTGAEFQIEGY